MSLKGEDAGIDPRVITEIADYYRKELGENIPPSFPFVGGEFNTTRAGIHADGLIKNEEIYNIFDTSKILNRPMNIAITDKSGTAGIALWINNFIGLEGGSKIDKNDKAVENIYQIIMEKYNRGRTTAMSNEEMAHLTKEYMPHYFESEFEKLKKKAGNLALDLVEEVTESDEIRSMDIETLEKTLEELQKQHDFIQFIYVVDRKGVKITRNIIDPKFEKDFQKKEVGVIYTDREWFSQPIKTGMAFVSNFYISKITNRLCITVAAPVRNKDDMIVGVLGIDISYEDLVRI